MKDCLITFRSITPAQRGESVLRGNGIPCRLMRTLRWMEARGCGYSIHLPISFSMKAMELLRQNQIPYQKVYQMRDGGKLEEMLI